MKEWRVDEDSSATVWERCLTCGRLVQKWNIGPTNNLCSSCAERKTTDSLGELKDKTNRTEG